MDEDKKSYDALAGWDEAKEALGDSTPPSPKTHDLKIFTEVDGNSTASPAYSSPATAVDFPEKQRAPLLQKISRSSLATNHRSGTDFLDDIQAFNAHNDRNAVLLSSCVDRGPY